MGPQLLVQIIKELNFVKSFLNNISKEFGQYYLNKFFKVLSLVFEIDGLKLIVLFNLN